MNYVGLFFIGRFLFYSLIPVEKLNFTDAQNILRPLDIFFPVIGLEIAANLLKEGTKLERIKKLFLLPPLYFLIPLFVLLISGIYSSPTEIFDLIILIFEVIFLLYTVIFSFTIAIDFPISGKKISELHVFALTTIGLGVLTFRSEEHTSELQSQSNLVCP